MYVSKTKLKYKEDVFVTKILLRSSNCAYAHIRLNSKMETVNVEVIPHYLTKNAYVTRTMFKLMDNAYVLQPSIRNKTAANVNKVIYLKINASNVVFHALYVLGKVLTARHIRRSSSF